MRKRNYVNPLFLFVFFLLSNVLTAQNKYIKICLQGIEYEKQGNPDNAIAKYNEAIALNPQDWTAYYYKSVVNFNRERYEDVITDVNQAIQYSPNNSILYQKRAEAFYRLKNYEKAIEDFNTILRMGKLTNYEMFSLYQNRGISYYSLNKYQEAISDFNKYFDLSVQNKFAISNINYFYRANSYFELEMYKDASIDFEKYLIENPANTYSLFRQGYCYSKLGEYEKSKINAQKLVEKDPVLGIVYSDSDLNEMYNLDKKRRIMQGLLKQAKISIQDYEQIPSKSLANIKLVEVFQLLDSAWLYTSTFNKSDTDQKDTIKNLLFKYYPRLKEKPEIKESARRYMVQAAKATEEKNYNDATILWNKALSISPYLPLAYYNKALLRDLQGLYDDAINNMNKYILLSPDAKDLRASKDKIYEWESKQKKPNSTNQIYSGTLNEILSKNYNPGSFVFALSFGGALGGQITQNNSLSNFWTTSGAPAGVTAKYEDTPHVLMSADIEAVLRPVKFFAVGAFFKTMGGIGSHSASTYHLNMPINSYGGFGRIYFITNDIIRKPDFYFQYSYGTSKLNGYYGIANSSSRWTYIKDFKADDAPYFSCGLGLGGKIPKHGYLVISGDYVSSNFSRITSVVTLSDRGDLGKVETISAKYEGFMFKMMFGFCF